MSQNAKNEVYGAVTVGEKGQVVIPVQLRKFFKIKPADKFIVFTKHGMICLVPTGQFNEFLDKTTAMLAKFKKIQNG